MIDLAFAGMGRTELDSPQDTLDADGLEGAMAVFIGGRRGGSPHSRNEALMVGLGIQVPIQSMEYEYSCQEDLQIIAN